MSQCNCGSQPLELPSTNDNIAPYKEKDNIQSKYLDFLQESKVNIPNNNVISYLILAFIIFAVFWLLSMSKYSLKL